MIRTRAVFAVLALAAVALIAALGTGAASGAGGGAAAVALKACGPVQYGGAGEPAALIVSDLPLQGDSRQRSTQMNDAIRLVLEGAGWQAGGTAVGFQTCDDSSPQTGLWTKAICRSNAKAYAADPSVLAVIGTYNSGCAEVEIPILGRAPGGGVAMVSPGNTAICLTESSPECAGGTPGSLYPKAHNYARVVPNDAYQGAGLASFAAAEGVRSAYVLYAGGDPTSLGQAKTFRGAAKQAGIDVVGFTAWNAKAKGYTALMEKVGATEPEAVLLAGLTEENGARLIKDKVAVLGPNTGAVKLLAPDGFAQQSTIELAGSASKGMFASVPGLVPQELPGPRQTARHRAEEDGRRPGRTVRAVRGPGRRSRPRRDRRLPLPRHRDHRHLPCQGQERHHRQLRHPAQRRSERRPDHRLPRRQDLRPGERHQAVREARRRRPPRLSPALRPAARGREPRRPVPARSARGPGRRSRAPALGRSPWRRSKGRCRSRQRRWHERPSTTGPTR